MLTRLIARLVLSLGFIALSFACCTSLAQENGSWHPYRKTKLTRPEDNLRFRTDEVLDPQEIPSRRRSVSPPGRVEPEVDAQEVAPAEENLPEPPRQRSVEPPVTDELPPARFSQPYDKVEPSLYPQTNEYVDEFDLMPGSDEMLFGDSELMEPPMLSKFKDGFFQKLNFQATNIDPAASSGFALTEIETALTVAVPAPTKNFPLLITPMFDARFLDGPVAPDLPPQLFTTGIDFMWVPKFGDRWRAAIAVAPMVYSDFQSSDADMFRLTGKGVVQWDAIPDKLQFMAGVLYLNRDDVRLFPVIGAIWNPTPYWNLELVFPRPKLARLINYGADHSDWVYVLGEFGGNSWAVQRDSGLQDKVTLRDLRVMLGVERRKNGGVNYRAEVGFVFAREIEYLSAPGANYEPADTVLLRLGTTF
jgi:hypothetical protein